MGVRSDKSDNLNPNPKTPETQGDLVKAIKELEQNLEKKNDATVRAVVPKVVYECSSPIKDHASHRVNGNVTMLCNQTLFGEDEYPHTTGGS